MFIKVAHVINLAFGVRLHFNINLGVGKIQEENLTVRVVDAISCQVTRSVHAFDMNCGLASD